MLRAHRERHRRVVMMGGFDIDAQAYFNAAGISNKTEKLAVNNLIVNLKGNNLWNSFSALYLISPTSLAAAAINARTPGTFNITWVNNPTHANTGVDFNGTTQYGRTGIIPSVNLTNNDFHISYYSRENVSAASVILGCNTLATQIIIFYPRYTDNNTYFDSYNSVAGQGRLVVAQASSLGFYIASRISNIDSRVFRNGVQYGAIVTGGSTQPTVEMYVGAHNNNGVASNFNNRECAFASIGLGLTVAQSSTLNNLVQTYNTNVIAGGRNV